ncbi:hypothetical protein GCM10009836_24690 [Pseudonocardia ailaonensis]|uniref:A-factor biosynthesis hotdog domain-containing protein n=1 Tax=Pseudonocardia ailaonensis TaxID=367279 RepID=A0ABN2N0F1_9PSEU
MVRDIRELTDQPEAYAEELTRRWSGLLSYRYIGRHFDSMDEGEENGTVPVRRDMRNPAGGLLVAPISIASPEGGLLTDLTSVPNPVVHSCHIVDPGHDVRSFEVRRSEDLRTGRRLAYSRSVIVDADAPDRVLAVTEGQGAIIGVPPAGLQRMPGAPLVIEDSPDLPPLSEAFGVLRRPTGEWALPELTVDVASPDAALHIGPQHVLLETAAMDAASAALGGPVQLRSWHVMFLARGKHGPFRVECEPATGTGSMVGVRMTLHDEGADDVRITSVSALFEAGARLSAYRTTGR